MKATTIARSGGHMHAVQEGATLCGAAIEANVTTGNRTPLGVWAAINTFSGRCDTCNAALETDPSVSRFVKA